MPLTRTLLTLDRLLVRADVKAAHQADQEIQRYLALYGSVTARGRAGEDLARAFARRSEATPLAAVIRSLIELRLQAAGT